jgi:hypothetical protein
LLLINEAKKLNISSFSKKQQLIIKKIESLSKYLEELSDEKTKTLGIVSGINSKIEEMQKLKKPSGFFNFLKTETDKIKPLNTKNNKKVEIFIKGVEMMINGEDKDDKSIIIRYQKGYSSISSNITASYKEQSKKIAERYLKKKEKDWIHEIYLSSKDTLLQILNIIGIPSEKFEYEAIMGSFYSFLGQVTGTGDVSQASVNNKQDAIKLAQSSREYKRNEKYQNAIPDTYYNQQKQIKQEIRQEINKKLIQKN